MPVVTEVTDPRNVEVVAEYADMLQVGARNMQNFVLLTEVGKSTRPVLLKRGMSATIEDLLMSAEYMLSQGNADVVLCERGIKSFDPATRNLFDVAAVPSSRVDAPADHRRPVPRNRPARFDSALCPGRLAAGADGVHIEVHDCPEDAKSDGPQALLPEQYREQAANAMMAELLGKTISPLPGLRDVVQNSNVDLRNHLPRPSRDSSTLIAGNWKMNTRAASAAVARQGHCRAVGKSPDVEVALCPPVGISARRRRRDRRDARRSRVPKISIPRKTEPSPAKSMRPC